MLFSFLLAVIETRIYGLESLKSPNALAKCIKPVAWLHCHGDTNLEGWGSAFHSALPQGMVLTTLFSMYSNTPSKPQCQMINIGECLWPID